MYARSTTIQAQPSSIDAGIAHVRDAVMPAISGVYGCVGLSLLVDRESGRCIATTAWENEAAMRASAERARPVRDQAAETFGGSPMIDEWEIAVLHRDHRSGPGACVRATWLRVRPDQFDRAIGFYRESVLPAIEELDGFCSASLMIDRASWRAVSSSTFDSLEAMQRNEEQARSLRTARLRDLGADQHDVGEFELALAHLRVPELV
ncbi:MAG TPA: antibiotic biosynthesis monooxygenase [Mycobacterium sp.]|jgi:heme-degrading monooxygenase HmoA|nr:antibiotic biosynthesis monooxygenase [Mycobacterium sp.]